MVSFSEVNVLSELRSADAGKRRGAEALVETQFAQEPLQTVNWLLDRLNSSQDTLDQQMAAVLLGKGLPAVWAQIGPQGQAQISNTFLVVFQKDAARSVLRAATCCLASLAKAQTSKGDVSVVEGLVKLVENLFAVESETARGTACMLLTELSDLVGANPVGIDFASFQPAVQMLIVSSASPQVQSSAVRCLCCLAQNNFRISFCCVAQLAQALVGACARGEQGKEVREESLRGCLQALQEEQNPQGVSLEVALAVVSLPRLATEEDTQAEAIKLIKQVAKRQPRLFTGLVVKSCVPAICGLCVAGGCDDPDDIDPLVGAACDGISSLASLLTRPPKLMNMKKSDASVLAQSWAVGVSMGADPSDLKRAGGLQCVAAAVTGAFIAAGKHEPPFAVELPLNVASSHDMFACFIRATTDKSVVVRRAVADSLQFFVDSLSDLQDDNLWEGLAAAIAHFFDQVAQDTDTYVRNSGVRIARAIALEIQPARLKPLLTRLAPALTRLVQTAVPAAFEQGIVEEPVWEDLEDRVGALALIVEKAGPMYLPYAFETANKLLRPLMCTASVPLPVKLAALTATGSVLAASGPPTASGEGAAFLPTWEEALGFASQALHSDEARSQSLGFYAGLSDVFCADGPLNGKIPLDLIVSTALCALNAPGATGELDSETQKVEGGGSRAWARTQSHEEARYALISLKTCLCSGGLRSMQYIPQILPVLAPRFAEAASPYLRIASLKFLEELAKRTFVLNRQDVQVSQAAGLSAQDLATMYDLSKGALAAIGRATLITPRSTAVCHEAHRILDVLKDFNDEAKSFSEQLTREHKLDEHTHEDHSDDESDNENHPALVNGQKVARKGG